MISGGINVMQFMVIILLFQAGLLFGQARTIKVGGISMEATIYQNFEHTLQQSLDDIAPLFKKAENLGLDLVILPESYFRGRSFLSEAQDFSNSIVLKGMQSMAKENKLYIVFQVIEKDGSNLYNTAVLLDREGDMVGKYRKVNLPPEESELAPGEHYPVFETDFGTIGILICWDTWFTSPAKNMVDQGAELIVVTAWNVTKSNMKLLAAENGVPAGLSVLEDIGIKSGIYNNFGDAILDQQYVGPYFLGYGEVEIGGYCNLALNKTARTSSDTGSKAVDGKYATEWASIEDNNTIWHTEGESTSWKAPSLPQWIEIDLGIDHEIDMVSIAQFNSDDYQYKIESKTEGGKYQLLSDEMNKLESTTEHGIAGSEILNTRFDMQEARYVRIIISSESKHDLEINEIKIFGKMKSQRPLK